MTVALPRLEMRGDWSRYYRLWEQVGDRQVSPWSHPPKRGSKVCLAGKQGGTDLEWNKDESLRPE